MPRKIGAELRTGERARASGNEGMARVCARRAAGMAIESVHPPSAAGNADIMSRLRALEADLSRPASVREAAGRLAAKVTGNSFAADPIGDALIIIEHILGSSSA